MRISDSPDDEVSFRPKQNKQLPEFKGVNVLPSPLTKQLRGPSRTHQMPNRGELTALASRLRRVHIDESPPRSRTAGAPAGTIAPARLSFEEEEAENKENQRRNPFGGFTPRQPKNTKDATEPKSTPLSDVSPNVIARKRTPAEVTASVKDAPFEENNPPVPTIMPQKRLSFTSGSFTPRAAEIPQTAVSENDEVSQSKTPSKVSFNDPVNTSTKSPVPSLKIQDINSKESETNAASANTLSARGVPMDFTPAVRDKANTGSKVSSAEGSEAPVNDSVVTDEPSPMNISETPMVQQDILAENLTVVLDGGAVHRWQDRCNSLNAISHFLQQSVTMEAVQKILAVSERLTLALVSHLGESRPNVIRSTLTLIETLISSGVSKNTKIPERLFDEVLDLACGHSLTAKDAVLTLSVLLADEQSLSSKLKAADNPARLLELLEAELASANHEEDIKRMLSSAYTLVMKSYPEPAPTEQLSVALSTEKAGKSLDTFGEAANVKLEQRLGLVVETAEGMVNTDSAGKAETTDQLPTVDSTPVKQGILPGSTVDNADGSIESDRCTGTSGTDSQNSPSSVPDEESLPALAQEPPKEKAPLSPKTPLPVSKPPIAGMDSSSAMPRLASFLRPNKDVSSTGDSSIHSSTPKAVSPPSVLRNKRLSSARRLSPNALRMVKRYTADDLEEAKRVAVLVAEQEFKAEQEKARAGQESIEKQLAAERKEKEELHAVLAQYEATMSKMATDKRISQRGPIHAMLDVEVSRLKTELFETTQAFTKLKERYAEAKEAIAVMESKESRVVEQNHELRQSLLELQKWSNDLKVNTEKKLAKAFENVSQFRTSFLDRDARANKALSELKLANRDLEQQKAACAETAAKLSATEALLHEAQDAKASLQAALQVARASLKDTTAERNTLREEADSSRLALARLQDDFDRLRESESKSADAVLRVASLELEARGLKANAYDQMSKMRKLEKQLEAKDKECEELNSICEELLSNLEKGKTSPPGKS